MSHGHEHSAFERLLEDPDHARQAAEALQALGTPSRLRILARLHASPAPVGELAEAVGMEASAVSHQLRVLRHLGLVVGRRDGRQVVYALYDDHVGLLLGEAVAHVEHVASGRADGAGATSAAQLNS